MSSPPTSSELRRDFVRALLLPALTLFVVPALGLGFAWYAQRDVDRDVLQAIHQRLDSDEELSAAEKVDRKAFYTEHPASSVCLSAASGAEAYRQGVCPQGGPLWQFVVAGWLSVALLALGLLGILSAVGLGLVALKRPALQYPAFVAGWRGFMALSAVEVVLQGALVVWLSYWVTAFFFNLYIPKLILGLGFLVLAGAWVAVRNIFRGGSGVPELEGQLLAAEANPRLWGHLAGLAQKVGTAPPSNVVAGIDDNFFVTEAPLDVEGTTVEGRSLYVSIPLLRVLSTQEADAVLAHELAHFRGGDTAASARLGPALSHYDSYLHGLGEAGFVTWPVHALMLMFRALFELARAEESRRRELLADEVAASTVSGEALGRALLKVGAYSSHRAATEQGLFERDTLHQEALALKDKVAAGLPAHVATAQFKESMQHANVPHPFDTHPPIGERLQALKSPLTVEDCPALMATPPQATWADEIAEARDLEVRLWTAYEQRFAKMHELSLAYRYLPATDEERALVERFFPEVTFPVKSGGEVRVTYEYLENVDGARVPFAEVESASVESGTFSTTLQVNHKTGASAGKGPTKVNLSTLKDDAAREGLKAAFGRYWERSQAAQAQASAAEPG